MEILKGFIASRFFKRVGNGVLDSIPLVSTLKNNIDSEDNNKGKGTIDYLRLIVALSFSFTIMVLVVAYLNGNVPLEELKEIVSLIIKPLFKLLF